jgi:hypothetical protein
MTYLRDVDLMLGLPWVDDEQASLQYGTTRVFTLMDGTSIEVYTKERLHECLLISSGKTQKLMRKTRQTKERNAKLHVINVTPTT